MPTLIAPPNGTQVASIARALGNAAPARLELARLFAAGVITIAPTKANAERVFGVSLRGKGKRAARRADVLRRAWDRADESARNAFMAEFVAPIWRVFRDLSVPPPDDANDYAPDFFDGPRQEMPQ